MYSSLLDGFSDCTWWLTHSFKHFNYSQFIYKPSSRTLTPLYKFFYCFTHTSVFIYSRFSVFEKLFPTSKVTLVQLNQSAISRYSRRLQTQVGFAWGGNHSNSTPLEHFSLRSILDDITILYYLDLHNSDSKMFKGPKRKNVVCSRTILHQKIPSWNNLIVTPACFYRTVHNHRLEHFLAQSP